ncbi:glycoside hydrolase family 3 C-terminal domain-containing protein [Streptomyces sp. NPDC051322]|uniref:glycoside hydrolase family 3 C-terminal domain-containing protein n=1 Tax=Streptomyces sp. NPDC051322 TaxID=3154645 RepID=UPI00345102CC
MTINPSRRQILKTGGLAVGGATLAGLGLQGLAQAATTTQRLGAPAVDYVFRDDAVDAGTRLADIMKRLTLDEKIQIATSGHSTAVPRLGLNAGRGGGGEGLHGVKDSQHATVFPSPLGMSQSWDEDLFTAVGHIVATESIADNGATTRLAPIMDLLHDPRAGRGYETMGEDAHLAGTFGRAITGAMNSRTKDGYQQFLPILKHFFGYNNEINRLWTNTVIPPRVAREHYSVPFRWAIEAGHAKSVMTCYHLINGKPMAVSPYLREMLDHWTPDYEGTGHDEYATIDDEGSGSSMWVHSQRYFPDDPAGRAWGSAQGTKNGQMSWSFRDYGDPVAQMYDALARGVLTERDIEANARRNLALTLRMGDFDQLQIRNPYTPETAVTRASLLPKHRKAALEASQEQIVLLKNEAGALPLRGRKTRAVVLLGSMGEEVLKDHYTGNWAYAVSLRDALQNKFGTGNLHYSRAVDTVAIKASNGKYLKSGKNPFSEPGDSAATDTPLLANGSAAKDNDVQRSEQDLLFEIYDYGGYDSLLRTPVNDLYAQVPHLKDAKAHAGVLINNTSAPGEASFVQGQTAYVNYQKLRLVPTKDGKFGIYSPVAGDGANNSYGESAMAYDQDDEDINNGSYLRLSSDGGTIVADATKGHVGPFRRENHREGPDITAAPFDRKSSDAVVDGLPDDYKFDFQTVQSSETAIEAALAAAPADAPVVLVVGYEPHLNAREAVDLQRTGLSAQQKRNIDYLTKTKHRDVILIVKTGSPMTIDESVHDNPRIKAILEIGHSGQEEGSSLVSVLFDDGYSVPEKGWAPTKDRYAPYAAYSKYPGYLVSGRSIPAYAPAGRLSATWYRSIDSMAGASEDHPPASYRWPAYDEKENDNLSNLNGTVPTGLLTYDIIKGQRTYQYFTGKPLYAFGYGLTYTQFAYSGVSVSEIRDGKFTVSGRVTNHGRHSSDEVVQIYSCFTGGRSRIDQPNNRLIAFARLKGIAPGESRRFRLEVDMAEKLGVWDVEKDRFIVEAGTYRIKAAKSSADKGMSTTLNVGTHNGGAAPARRNLNRLTVAENFDDYSDIGGRVQDIELISASTDYHSNTAVEFRQDGAWVVFKDVALTSDTSWLTLRLASDRTGAVKVYAVPSGKNPGALKTVSPLATFRLEDTRPVRGLPTGLGIGPIAVTGQAHDNRPYPGSPAGQNGKDVHGRPYKDAYVKPDWHTVAMKAQAPRGRGTVDVYIVSEHRGARLEWLAFGSERGTTRSVKVDQPQGLDSVRKQAGVLQMRAELTPVTSVSPVTWSVSALDGSSTSVATIDGSTGTLRATGKGNGKVLVTAISAGKKAAKEVLVTNQRDANKVTVDGKQKTVDYILLRTGDDLGLGDSIQRYKGTSPQTAVFGGLFDENSDGYYLAGEYRTLPAGELEWKVTDLAGSSTKLATVDAKGLLAATGEGDGEVLVTAVLKNNPDISAARAITLSNQGHKDAYKMVQAAAYDATSEDNAQVGTTWGFGGNQFGLRTTMPAGSTWTYRNVDFAGARPEKVSLRLAPDSDSHGQVTVEVWADAPTAGAGGKRLGTVKAATSGSNVAYATFSSAIIGKLSGVHDIYLKPSVAARVMWFAFSS